MDVYELNSLMQEGATYDSFTPNAE